VVTDFDLGLMMADQYWSVGLGPITIGPVLLFAGAIGGQCQLSIDAIVSRCNYWLTIVGRTLLLVDRTVGSTIVASILLLDTVA
jgi:hypothetical protein